MLKPLSLCAAIAATAALACAFVTPISAETPTNTQPNFLEEEEVPSGEKRASEKAAQTGAAEVKKMVADIKSIAAAIKKAADEGNATIRKIEDPRSAEGRAERAKIIADYNKFRDAQTKKRKELIEKVGPAFGATDLAKWDLEKDGETVHYGLFYQAQSVAKDNPKKAVELLETLLEKASGFEFDGVVRRNALPGALMRLDNYEAALKKMKTLAMSAPAADVFDMAVKLGELHATHGKIAEAAKTYQDAAKVAPAKPSRQQQRIVRLLKIRAEQVGKKIANIDSKIWYGADAKPFAKLEGKVLLLDFFGTWCPPCIRSIPSLNDMHKELHEEGFMVVGVTKHFQRGFLPKDMGALRKGELGARVSDMDEEVFADHFKAFVKNVAPDYPMVVASGEDFGKVTVPAYPTMYLVDHKGMIANVIIGGGQEAAIHMMAENLLKIAKADKKKADASKEEPAKDPSPMG